MVGVEHTGKKGVRFFYFNLSFCFLLLKSANFESFNQNIHIDGELSQINLYAVSG